MNLSDYINAYRGPLIGLLASWGAPWGDAAEIAQDSFAEAWMNRESCRANWKEHEIFGRWLRGVARNRFRDWARRHWRHNARTVTLTPELIDDVPAPDDTQSAEHLDALRQAIERLPAKQRQVVLMHYLEESSVKEVAALLSVSSKTVEGRLFQARRTLRRLLGDEPSAPQIGVALLCL